MARQEYIYTTNFKIFSIHTHVIDEHEQQLEQDTDNQYISTKNQ